MFIISEKTRWKCSLLESADFEGGHFEFSLPPPPEENWEFSVECIKHNAIFLQHWKIESSSGEQFAFILIGNNSDSFYYDSVYAFFG